MSADPAPLFESGHLRHVAMDAGDIILFLGAAQTHGAMTWHSDVDRAAILFNVWSRAHVDGYRPKM